ncbi:MAG: ferritin [Planctomycetes bacterium]|nr:ferritin [Planctomycetota bacterium]MBI3847924.1 ferritin [Planctomycetota bacterium]
MVSSVVEKAINEQINNELSSSYAYLAMSAFCESQNFHGCARWFRIQSQEEYGHGMKLFDFLLRRGGTVKLDAISEPTAKFKTIPTVFDQMLKQEMEVSKQIDQLYELAFKEKAFAAMVELQWFLTEQVEEEKTARELVAKFNMAHDDAALLIDLDRELGGRAADAT